MNILWTAETRASVWPLRDRPDFPLPPLPVARDAWKSFASKRRTLNTWEAARITPHLTSPDAVARFNGAQPTTEDAASDAQILFALLNSYGGEILQRYCTWLAGAFGGRYVTKVLTAAWPQLQRDELKWNIYNLQEPCVALRLAIAHLSADDYAAACAEIQPLYAISNNPTLVLLGFLFPDAPADHDALFAHWQAPTTGEEAHTRNDNASEYAFGFATTPAQLDALKVQYSNTAAAPLTLIARAGEAGAQALCALVGAGMSHAQLTALRALSLCDYPPAASTLLVAAGVYPTQVPFLRAWVLAFPEHGLAPLAAHMTEHAHALLKEIARTETAALRALLPSLEEDAQKRLQAILNKVGDGATEASQEALPAPLQGAAQPPAAWVREGELPEVLLAGGRAFLASDARNRLAGLAYHNTSTLPQVAALLDRPTLNAFLFGLLDAWVRSPDKGKTILLGIARALDDAGARLFMKRVEAWASSSGGFHDATTGLEGLTLRGDSGLRLVHRMSQKAKSQGLKRRASSALESAARARKLTRNELEDRLVPDLDLAANGTCTLNFGPRQFVVGFDEALKPVVKDTTGKVLKDLPKPNSSDDAEKAAEAVERWKSLKKDVRELASLQISRLETAMIDGRSWPMEAFLDCFVTHPLMQHLARRVVWGATTGKTVTPFRVAEDGSFADESDSPLTLPEKATVHIVHPIELSSDARAAWGQVFADYALIQPFPQIGRAVFVMTPDERSAGSLARFVGQKMLGGRLYGLAGKPGWQKGGGEDNGTVFHVYRQMGTDWLDVEFTPGINIMGGYGADEEQTLKQVKLRRGTFASLSDRAASELLLDLSSLQGH